MSRIITGLLLCLGLAACGTTSAGTANSNTPVGAPSGISASNGGGQRELGNALNFGATSGGTTIGNVPNAKGNSY